MHFVHNLTERKTRYTIITGNGKYPVDTSANSWEQGRSEKRTYESAYHTGIKLHQILKITLIWVKCTLPVGKYSANFNTAYKWFYWCNCHFLWLCVRLKRQLISWNGYICVALLQDYRSNPAERLEKVTHFKQLNDRQLQRLTWSRAPNTSSTPPPEAHLMQSDNSGNRPIQSELCVLNSSLYWFLQPTPGWKTTELEKDGWTRKSDPGCFRKDHTGFVPRGPFRDDHRLDYSPLSAGDQADTSSSPVYDPLWARRPRQQASVSCGRLWSCAPLVAALTEHLPKCRSSSWDTTHPKLLGKLSVQLVAAKKKAPFKI